MIFRWCRLKKKKMTAGRNVQIGGSNNGLVVTGDVGSLNIQYGVPPSSDESAPPGTLSDHQLRDIAAKLLLAGQPPSLQALPIFRNASELAQKVLSDLADIPRVAEELNAGEPRSAAVIELLEGDCQHCLVVAPPGTGKTHALWNAARSVLAKGTLIPIFISAGRLNTWEELCSTIADIAGEAHVDRILRDSRVCVILDGWSEFASGLGLSERAKMARILSNTRALANGRLGVSADSSFVIWRLQPLQISVVTRSLRTALPSCASPDAALVEFLRLPLALTLFILLGGQDRSRGKLLARFHRHLTSEFPDKFTDILMGAVAAVELSNQRRSYDRLLREIRDRAEDISLAEPLSYLSRLGLLDDNGGTVVPIHDLYWSWLVGNGLLADDRVLSSLPTLLTRESYELALESGAKTSHLTIDAIQKVDSILAAQFNAYGDLGCRPDDGFTVTLRAMFSDNRLAVRCRAALSGLYSRDPEFLRPSLDVISALHEARIYYPAFSKALTWADLYEHRDIVFEWLGSPGSEQIFDTIALDGDARWVEWLELAANSKGDLIGPIIGCALAGCTHVPRWTEKYLHVFIKNSAWMLRQATARGINVGLARWLAENYEICIDQRSGGFFDINKLLVACGDDLVFERLLLRFPNMEPFAQERLGYAVVEKGGAWIARFQQVAFKSGEAHAIHHKLREVVSLEISDETAREWIVNGPSDLGWRVLIARYENELVPELIGGLPDSFSDLHTIPTLTAIRHLSTPPESLIEEIWRRVRGNMQPAAMESVIIALVNIGRKGIGSIISYICASPFTLPIYHVRRFGELLGKWEERKGEKFRVIIDGQHHGFMEWILTVRFTSDRHDFSYREIVARFPDLAVRLILERLQGESETIRQWLERIEPLAEYNPELLKVLLQDPELAKIIPRLLSRCSDVIPEEQLLKILETPGVDFDDLVRRLGPAVGATHRKLNEYLVKRVFSLPFDISRIRDLSKVLRASSRSSLEALLKPLLSESDLSLWLIREIESDRQELLIDEYGCWL
jgi:hypothetical protein